MGDSQNIKDELKEFAPDLFRMEKKEGFQVPPRYFDRLGDEIMYKMKMEEEAAKVEKTSWLTTLVTSLQSLLQPRLAVGMAAAVLLFIGIQRFGPGASINPAEQNLTFASLTDAEFDSYLAANIQDFEEDLLNELDSDMSYVPESIEDEELDGYFEENPSDIDFNTVEELLL